MSPYIHTIKSLRFIFYLTQIPHTLMEKQVSVTSQYSLGHGLIVLTNNRTFRRVLACTCACL